MSLSDRRQKPVRMSPDNARRLEAAAKSSGKYESRFMEDAIMRAVEEEEARVGARRDERDRRRGLREDRRGGDEPVGLGLRPRAPLMPSLPPPEEEPRGVVVNVGTSLTANGETARLAAWILAAPDYERDTRMHTAVEILKAGGGTTEEKEVLAAQLEAAVRARGREKPTGGLRGLLRGEGLSLSWKDVLG